MNEIPRNNLYQQLLKRKNALAKVRQEIKKEVSHFPEGKLRITHSTKSPQYFIRSTEKDKEGIYIRKADRELAYQLAQKDYDVSCLNILDEEILKLDSLINIYKHNLYEQELSKLNPMRQKLITPVYKSDEKYVADWLAVEYEGKPFKEDAPEYYTKRGERVRSKSEIMIADALTYCKIPYRYEFPVTMKNGSAVYPDFYCLNVKTREEVIWEHFGLMSNPEYVENAVFKYNSYVANGYEPGRTFVMTFESESNFLSTRTIDSIINQIFK